jgi:hypothetical protein
MSAIDELTRGKETAAASEDRAIETQPAQADRGSSKQEITQGS